MLAYLVNIFWIAISIMLAVMLVLFVLLFVLLVTYISIKEEAKPATKSMEKLTFNGPSRIEMIRTTSRLLKQSKKTRKYRRPYYISR